MYEDEDPPHTTTTSRKVGHDDEGAEGEEEEDCATLQTSRLLSLLRHIKVRSSFRWDGFFP